MQNSIIEEDFGDIIGQKPEDIASNEETLKLWKDNNRRAFSGETVKGEVSFPIKGKMKYFYNIITPIWEEKRIDGILGVNIDITELKIIEKKLKRSEGNYRETYNRAEFYKDIFAHDINNILQNILSAVELFEIFLRKGRNFSEIERLMKLIKNQINRGSKLVRNIKNLSGTITDARLVPVNFYGLLQGIIEEITQEFKNRELKIDINIQNKSLEVKANHLLKDVFENIIQNAIAYNNNKIINLQVNIFRKESEGIDYIQFEFIDNGIGIEEERKRLIFHRIDNAANNIEGIGLGLSMIKKIIECYRGSIWVENKIIDDYTKGSKFVFLIPEAKK
ncbi:MAG: HAMP domain-containing sensor histidine kinase [Candidatus Lokiarchaeota archaeon]